MALYVNLTRFLVSSPLRKQAANNLMYSAFFFFYHGETDKYEFVTILWSFYNFFLFFNFWFTCWSPLKLKILKRGRKKRKPKKKKLWRRVINGGFYENNGENYYFSLFP